MLMPSLRPAERHSDRLAKAKLPIETHANRHLHATYMPLKGHLPGLPTVPWP